MPNLLHTAHTSRHYSVPSVPNHNSSPATLVRRGGDGNTTGVFVIIAGIIGGIGAVLTLLGWAHKKHQRANAERKTSNQRGGWDRPARRADARHGASGPSRTGRSRSPDEESAAGGYGEHTDGPYEMQAPPSAYMRGSPSVRSKAADIRFPGPRYGYGGSNDGRSQGGQSGRSHGSHAGSGGHGSRFGAPTADQYFERR